MIFCDVMAEEKNRETVSTSVGAEKNQTALIKSGGGMQPGKNLDKSKTTVCDWWFATQEAEGSRRKSRNIDNKHFQPINNRLFLRETKPHARSISMREIFTIPEDMEVHESVK